jgi:hypothetical protein
MSLRSAARREQQEVPLLTPVEAFSLLTPISPNQIWLHFGLRALLGGAS